MSDFKSLNLSTKILDALEKKGYVNPTPIQAQAIPHILAGKDLLGIAQTGTGKTAAFSLPILDNLHKSNISVKTGCIRVLILTPTRELASQISENIETYGKEFGLKHAVIFGGVSERPQITALQRGLDILVATPGRLLDLVSQGYVRFAQIETFVLDEADRMLDMGFINDVKKIIAKLPQKKQTLFFSATMPETISDLANSILKDPVQIEVTPVSSTVDRIEQKIHFVDKNHKTLLLKKIIKQEEVTSVLVFSKTKHGANRVVEYLSQQAISVAAIHGNKSQGAREKALSQFRAGEIKVLVATDIAARGIDIPGISHVINFDIPMDPESYVHRIGRTARAGREGVAISFCDPSERRLLQAVEKLINFKVPVDDTHPYHGVESVAEREDSFDAPRRRQPQRSAPQRRESSGGYDSRRPRGGEFSDSRKPAGARTRSSSSEGNQSRSRFKSDSDAPRDRNFSSRSSDSFSKSRKTDSAKSSFGGLKKKPHFGSDSARSSFGDSDSRPRFSSFDKRKSDVEFGNRAPRNTERDDNFGNTERGSLSRRKSEDGGFGFTERRKPFGFGGRSAGFGQRTDSRTGQRSDSRSDRPFGAKRSESGFGQRTEGNFARKSSGGFGNSSGGGFGARSSRPSSGGFGKKRPSSNSGGNWKGNR